MLDTPTRHIVDAECQITVQAPCGALSRRKPHLEIVAPVEFNGLNRCSDNRPVEEILQSIPVRQ